MKTTLPNYSNALASSRSITTPQPPARQPRFVPETEAMRHCERGRLLLHGGQYERALQQFEQALAWQPHAIAGWCGRAEALACLDRHAAALSSVEQAQALSTVVDTQIWLQKAVLLIWLERYEEALYCCTLILHRHPDHVQAWLFQGVALHLSLIHI